MFPQVKIKYIDTTEIDRKLEKHLDIYNIQHGMDRQKNYKDKYEIKIQISIYIHDRYINREIQIQISIYVEANSKHRVSNKK